MRILQAYLSSEFSGSERHAIELANGLAARHNVSLLVRRLPVGHPARQRLEALCEADVEIIEIPTKGAGVWMLGAALCHRPALIHAHNSRAARLAGTWLPHLTSVATLHVGYRERAHRRCKHLICLTEDQRQDLPADRRRIASVVENWVMPHRRLRTEEIHAIRLSFGAKPSTFVIGAAGRLAPEKGFDSLISAMQIAALPDALLVIAGSGPERERLEALAGRETKFLGFRHDVRDLYQAFDVFVMSSLMEHFGLVLLEAMEAKVQVISTATVGGRNILESQPAGEIVPVGDVSALADAIRRSHARRGRRCAYHLEGFSLQKKVEQIEQLYCGLLSSPS